MHSDIICGLDIGSSSVRAVIAQALHSHSKDKASPAHLSERILGFSEAPTKGFSKGVVSNLTLLSDAIETAVSKAESQAHRKIRKVVTNVSGVHIRTFKSRGSVHISDRPGEITEDVVKRCIESAKLIAMSLDREVLHLIPEKFYIDDKMEISDPLGLYGSKLDVNLNIVTTLVSILQNLAKAVNLAGYEVEDVISSGAGTALAVFDKKQIEEGAIILDVGKDCTEATLFADSKMRDSFHFPFGSDDLTQVLQDRLRIVFEEAEDLRKRCGIAIKKNQDLYEDTEILIPSLLNRPGPGHEDAQFDLKMGGNWVDSEATETGARLDKANKRINVVSRREISNLLFSKVEEIMQELYKKIGPFVRQRKTLPYICVAGGPSNMDGFIEAVEEIFGVPVNMARIQNAKDFHDNNFACSLGLVRYGLRKRLGKRSKYILNPNSFTARLVSHIQSLISEYF